MQEFDIRNFINNKNAPILKNGVYYISDCLTFTEFEASYLQARKREQRILDDEQVKKLPFKAPLKQFQKEWKMRAISFVKFYRYCIRKKQVLKILEVGSGNGWCAAKLSGIPGSYVCAVDVNHLELEQAARLFPNENLFFLYADIFGTVFKPNVFDIIILNASIQYFQNLPVLFKQLKYYLNENGEIHILDSPFYLKANRSAANERSNAYYNSINVPEMRKYYFHHSFTDLETEKYTILYQPEKSYLKKLFRLNVSPFPWICIKKD